MIYSDYGRFNVQKMKDRITIRRGTFDDIQSILSIYESARKFMRANNNMSQWINGYPNVENVKNDIENGNCFVGENNQGELVLAFAFIKGEDPTYKVIREGNWLNEDPYGTIHRLGSNGKTRGVLKISCEYCFREVENIRIDTHKDNKPMLNALNNLGFEKCGEIICSDGTPRIAFQKTKFHKKD